MSQGSGDLAIGSVLEGRYELLSLLGRGGYGLVYKARQLNTGQLVAVKLLLVDRVGSTRQGTEVARFEREMKLIGQIRHPNVVRLIDSGQLDDGRLFLVLEYLEGESLAALLNRGRLPVRQAHRVLRQVLEALARAHQTGVIHRDLKPHNIMVTDAGPRCNAVVLDFGVSFVAEEARDADYRTLTARDEVAGTPGYMAPEQLISGDVSASVDIYAWGLCAIEALSGRPALPETSLVKLVLRYGSAKPIDLPEVLAASPFGPVLERATAVDPADRYASAEEALVDLEAIDLRAPAINDLEGAMEALAPAAAGTAAAGWESTIDSVPARVGAVRKANPVPGAPPVPIAAPSASQAGTPEGEGTRTALRDAPAPETPRPPERHPLATPYDSSELAAEASATPVVPLASPSATGPTAVTRGLERTLLLGVGLVVIGVALVLLLTRGGDSNVAGKTEAVTLDVPAGAPTADEVPVPDWLPQDDGPALGTVPVPPGSFIMGCNETVDPTCPEDQRPAHRVELDGFAIDVTEVTVAAYGRCVRAGVCEEPVAFEAGRNPGCNWGRDDRIDHPVNCVSWYQAQLYCEWLGMRLPTEAEWERAARGDDGRLYPWGNGEPDCDLVVFTSGTHGCSHTGTEPVASRPRGVSPYGVHGLAGNVSEWVADWYENTYYARSSVRNPVGPPGGAERSQRGADFNDEPDEVKASERESSRPWDMDDDLGFRCVRSLE